MVDIVVLRMSYQWLINYNYLIVDPVSGQAVVVDPAWEMDKIENALSAAQADLAGILLTHADPDHTHLSRPLAARHGCPIWMSQREISSSKFDAAQLVGVGQNPWPVGRMMIHPLLTPGHSRGSTCYLVEDNLFTGDTLFSEGCGLCHDLEGAKEMYSSLEFLKKRLDPRTRIYPGHSYGKPVGQTFADVCRENIYLQFTNEATFVAFRMRKGQSQAKLFDFH